MIACTDGELLCLWQALSNTVWALSKLDTLDEALFTAIVQQVLDKLTRFNAQNVANTVSLTDGTSAHHLNRSPTDPAPAHHPLLNMLYLPAQNLHGALRDISVLAQIWGFANMGFDPGQQLWDAVAQNSIYTMHEYSPQNIANGELH